MNKGEAFAKLAVGEKFDDFGAASISEKSDILEGVGDFSEIEAEAENANFSRNRSSVRASVRAAALYKLSRQAMPTKKLVEYLQKKSYSADEIAAVVAECTNNKWLDDEAWIAMKVKSLVAKHKSRRDMIFYFFRYGFQKEQVEPFLPDDTKEALQALIEKKYSVLLDPKADHKARHKAIQALLRRGFSFDEILQHKENT